jgi:hypothetical protein
MHAHAAGVEISDETSVASPKAHIVGKAKENIHAK